MTTNGKAFMLQKLIGWACSQIRVAPRVFLMACVGMGASVAQTPYTTHEGWQINSNIRAALITFL